MDTGGEHQITILCPKELAASSTNRGLYWLIGSPFLPPITVVSSLRCLHFQDNDPLSPDYTSESDSLRALVIRGFDVIGALCVGDAKREANAKRAVDAAMMLRKDFRNNGGDAIGVRSSCGVVGAGGDLVSGGASFYISESTGSSFDLRPIVSVTNCEGNADKFVWEKGCLLRCPVEFKLPLYVPEGKVSDAQKMLSSAMEDVIAKLRDSQVAFLIEGINGTSKPIVLHGAEINLMHTSDFNLHEHAVVETGNMALPCSHFIAKGKGSSAHNLRENADIIRVTVLLNKSRNGQNCYAPAAQFVPATSSPRLVTSSFKLDVLSYSSVDFPISSSISRLIVPGIIDQLITLSKAIGPNILSPPQLCPYHFLPQGILHPITAIYDLSYGETEMLQVEIRRSLHMRMGLPLDRPLLRMANALTFGGEGSSTSRTGSVIRDVHISIPRSGVSGGISSLVDGSYEYYHYLQDGLDDNGWGCAYRSLQTIISWFRLHHYTSLKVPLHREIQKTLVEIGDKDPSFVGSREWIGAIELSFVLDRLLGVSCKIINVRSGAELPEKCRELALHFKNQGTPIMIGGGVLAYTLLGVDYNGASGDCAFLILDPHYTGDDEEKKIVSGGWCGWKKPVDSKGRNFFLNDKFYNLLLPQRPSMV